MKFMIKPLALATAMIAASTSTQVMALEAGDWIFRAGVTTVDPNESSDQTRAAGAPFAGVDLGEVGVDSDTQLGITVEYMLSNNLGIELLAATPFQHTVSAKQPLKGVLGGSGEIGDVKHLPPTLSLNYHFNSGSNFQPYIGLGINYTIFFDEDESSELEGIGGDGFELEDSWGLAAQVGFDYHLSEKWLVNGSVRYIDIETDAEVKNSVTGKVTVDNVEIDPYVYTLSVGYKF